MFKKSPLKATHLHQRKRRLRILKITAVFVALGIVIGGFSWLSRIQSLKIENVHVAGNIGIDTDDVKIVAEKHLAGAYVALFSKSNKVIYPKEAILKDMRESFPSIETLEIKAKGNTLNVDLTERRPAYVWCTGMPSEKQNAKCYFVDKTGYIYAQAPQISGDAYLTFYGVVAQDAPIGKTYLSGEEFIAVDNLKKMLDAISINVRSFVAKENNVRELYLTHGGKIMFKAHQDPQSLISSLELLKANTDLFKSATRFEYIDLRFGNKVYYKLVGDNPVQTGE